MIHILTWRAVLPSGDILDSRLLKDIFYLKEVIERLKTNGYTFISKCNQGIIFEDTEGFPDPFEPDILLKEDKPTEVTGEFFLFYDHLPEHIKKEIKIYINKTEE